MKLNPLGSRMVAKPVDGETKTASGILLPQGTADRAKPELADVIAVGPEVAEVKVGDRVVYAKYGPEKFKHKGVDVLVINEEDCLATVTE